MMWKVYVCVKTFPHHFFLNMKYYVDFFVKIVYNSIKERMETMVYWMIVVVVTVIVLLGVRYIRVKEVGSFPGYLVRVATGFVTYLFRNHTLKLEQQYKKLNKITEWKVKEGTYRWYTVKNYTIDGLEASMLTPKKWDNKKILLQLHGGGYEIDLPYNNLYFAKKYATLLKTIAIFTINYRVAPENKYPAALEDAVKAYKWLLEQGYEPQNIMIVGDSAGGGLAIATAMYLRDHQMPLPKALITMSAWTDLTNEEASFTENYKKDPVFGNSKQSVVYTSTYAEGRNKKDPYISPMYGDFTGLPDMLMQVGTHEMLLSDTTEVAKKAKEAGVLVELDIYEGMFHIFQKYKGFLPESDAAWRKVRSFLSQKFYT